MNEIAPATLSASTLWRIAFFGVLVAALFLGLLARAVALQLLDDDDYRGQAKEQSRRYIVVPAPRGNIYDRRGRLLVGNKPMFSIAADVSMLRPAFDKEFSRLRRGDLVLKELNGKLETLKYKDKAERDQLADAKSRRVAELRNIAPANVLETHIERLNRLFRRGVGEKLSVDLKTVGTHLSGISGKRIVPFTLVSDISEEEHARFVEHEPPGSPLFVHTEPVRAYPHGEIAAHVLGYVSSDRASPGWLAEHDKSIPQLAEYFALSPEARKRNTQKLFDGQRAISGVERRFDQTLKGAPGYRILTVRPNGYAHVTDDEAPPRQGAHLTLSLDIEFQRAIEHMLKEGFPYNRSSVVVLDIRSGEVLACANWPSFDPARMRNSEYLQKYLDDYDALFNPTAFERDDAGGVKRDESGKRIRRPDVVAGKGAWLNHATQGLYPPGSSFKPITAIASLRSGLITPDRLFECASFIEIGKGRHKKKFLEHDRRAFGQVNISKMLQVSSNVFCYQAALEIGIDRLAAEAKRFGLGEKTSVELPALRGQMPDPEWRRRRMAGQGWSEGDTANTAVGQGDVETTPMHLAAMIASIARNETRTDVTIIRDPARDFGHRHRGESIGLTMEQYEAVLNGLVACARDGTGRNVFKGLEGRLTVAAKTGTAQIKRNTANLAWTIAYAPVEKPEIALAVLIEGTDGNTDFGGGKNAGPIANGVLREWLKIREQQSAPAPTRLSQMP
ncbi:MAG: hypothetical protein LBT53_08010 [Puniceicoccales bacterium]|jgi:penicillin-binding protein 2|nr:hypothetical protein [Puniceicoccales bacterium]